MKRRILAAVLFIISATVVAGCAGAAPEEPAAAERAVITDRDGRPWDVTHARDAYGMNPEFFNFGIGVGAIPSVDDPRVIAEGEPGYPAPDEAMFVFGVEHNDERRAYSVSDLRSHEVFNDFYPGASPQHLAVTY